MHENKYNNYRIPAGLLITFLEKALLLIHMETHLNDVRIQICVSHYINTERRHQDMPATLHSSEPSLLRRQCNYICTASLGDSF
jgi:hypothetical protein